MKNYIYCSYDTTLKFTEKQDYVKQDYSNSKIVFSNNILLSKELYVNIVTEEKFECSNLIPLSH